MAIRIVDPILCSSVVSTPPTLLAAYDASTDVVIDVVGLKEKALLVQAAVAGLTYTVLGSLDDGVSYDLVIKADTPVLTGAQDLYRDSAYCTHWKVRLKGAGSAATVKFAAIGN